MGTTNKTKKRGKQLDSSTSSDNSGESVNVISDVRRVLASVVGSSTASDIISSAEDDLGVTNVDNADSPKKKLFFDFIMASDKLSLQSFQKRLIIKDKLRSILL